MKFEIQSKHPQRAERCVVCREDANPFSAVLLKAVLVKQDGTGRQTEETVWGVAHERCAGGELKKKSYGLKWTGPDILQTEHDPQNINVVAPLASPAPSSELVITEETLRRVIREELERILKPNAKKTKR